MPRRRLKRQRSTPPAPEPANVELTFETPFRVDHRTQRLCRQVFRAIEYSLGADMHNDRLAALYVISVVPLAGASQLMVYLGCHDALSPADLAMIHKALDDANGALRTAVATAITRRRAPHLSFRVIKAPRSIASNLEQAADD